MGIIGSRFKVIFPIGLFLIILSGATSVWFIHNLREALKYEKVSKRIWDRADDIHDSLLKAELSESIYIVTHDSSDLLDLTRFKDENYRKINELQGTCKLIKELNCQEELMAIQEMIGKKIVDLETTIEFVKKNRKNKKLNLAKIKFGKSLTFKFNEKISEIKSKSKNLTDHHNSFVSKYTQVLVVSFSICLFFSVILFFLNLQIVQKQLRISYAEKEELERAKELALEASQLKSKFLAIVSHEIRTPLNGIIGLSDLLRKSELGKSEKKFATLIHNSGKTLLRIINDILDFSKIETGKLEFESECFEISEIVQHVFQTMESKASEKSLYMTYSIDKDTPKYVEGDSGRLTQVLFNLIGNAIKFTSIGSVILKVKREFQEENQSANITFSIEDTGIGMSPNHLKDLFKPFSQLQKVGTSGEAGSGLGLSISQTLVKAMGGEIRLESTSHRGSVFVFTLPFKKFSEEKIVAMDLRPNREEAVTINKIFDEDETPTILVAEDNTTNQITIETMLTRLGAHVVIAANGKEVLDLTEKTIFDLILMDCQMPVMDGYEATKELRKQKNRTPIYAMTANASHEDRRACLDSGMDDHISKPISVDILKDMLVKKLKPEVTEFNEKTLIELEKNIGREGRDKVVVAFKKSLVEFKKECIEYEDHSDLESLRKTAHRYKSSSLTVGAMGLAHICMRLEKIENREKIFSLLQILKKAFPIIEEKLI